MKLKLKIRRCAILFSHFYLAKPEQNQELSSSDLPQIILCFLKEKIIFELLSLTTETPFFLLFSLEAKDSKERHESFAGWKFNPFFGVNLRLFQHTELEHTPIPLPTGYKGMIAWGVRYRGVARNFLGIKSIYFGCGLLPGCQWPPGLNRGSFFFPHLPLLLGGGHTQYIHFVCPLRSWYGTFMPATSWILR